MKVNIIPHTLCFTTPVGTSRGVYYNRNIWYIVLHRGRNFGIGEAAPLPNLSIDYIPNFKEQCIKIANDIIARLNKEIEHILPHNCEQTFDYTQDRFNKGLNIENKHKEYIISVFNNIINNYYSINQYPSILFALETAVRDFVFGSNNLWHSPFTSHEVGIDINGLIWMGDYDYMFNQIKTKIADGYKCIKLKIGAINFDDEIKLLQYIRQNFSKQDIELRVDANGAFSPKDALYKLDKLSKLNLHSIEQPIMYKQWEDMAKLCANTPLPIALDEELIPCINHKEEVLNAIKPQYIIIKPSLHGGIIGGQEWIKLANKHKIGYWITSALESNIGLNAIAQWCAALQPTMPQGLGTGLLFKDNIDMGLYINKAKLYKKKHCNSFSY